MAAARCRHCEGPLHRGDDRRKPRGGLLAAAGEALGRASFPTACISKCVWPGGDARRLDQEACSMPNWFPAHLPVSGSAIARASERDLTLTRNAVPRRKGAFSQVNPRARDLLLAGPSFGEARRI